MEVKNLFNYIGKLPRFLDELLEEIEKLNFGKLSYSVQELQSIDILSDENENRRILGEAEEYLGLCNQFLYRNSVGNEKRRKLLDGSLVKKEIGDGVNIDVSDLKSKIFTLADLSFKANKLTKILCERAIQTITGENMHSNGNIDLKNVIKSLEEVYRNSNSETGKRIPIKEQLDEIRDNLIVEPENTWRKDINPNLTDQEVLEFLFNDLCPIWHVRDVLYEIKSQLNTELIRCLIEDNYTEFKNWGFARDENGKLVFNFDSRQVAERYGYHVPMMDKLLSADIIEQLEQNNIPYVLDFTSIVRKSNLDRVIDADKSDGQTFLTSYKARLIELLKSVDLEHYTQNEYDKVNELYILGKLMSVGTRDRLVAEYPELEKQCDLLKELVNPSKASRHDLSDIDVENYQTEYEKFIMEQIEEILERTKTIYMQKGNNLDKQASKYAIRKHMKDKYGIDIKVIEIDAGEKIEGEGLFVDAGKLEGIEGYGKNFEGRKRRFTINANASRAQKSTCGVLSQYGFYVPEKIVQYADGVSDERILLPRYGVNVSRNLIGQKLFDFAEARREDGTYLFESELTDEELKQYSTEPKKGKKGGTNLLEICEKRQRQIERDTKEIAENIYVIHTEQGEKYVAVMDHIVNCGAMISYSLGCDYYVSVANEKLEGTDKKDDHYNPNRATFTVDANPRKGDGRLPEQLLEWCRELRDNGENDIFKMVTVERSINEVTRIQRTENEKPFIKPTKDMVVFGGPKTPHLYVEFNDERHSAGDETLKEAILYELTDLLGARAMEKEDRQQVVEQTIDRWKNIGAKTLAYRILVGSELTLTDVENEINTIENIAKEKGGIEHDITSD
ncbi:MAG: hypothetical protein IKF38_06440 [Clostridia bacterium]|nr:hypothetical protein [Clostridia bacterium]